MARKPVSNEEVLRQMPMLDSTLTETERALILQNLRVQKYKRHEKIYAEGERPRDLLFVISGKVKIFKFGAGGRSQIIRVALPKAFMGYRPYFAHQDYLTSAEAMEPCKVAHLSLQMLSEMMHENAELACFFINELSQHLGTAHERTVNLTQKHIRGRLAEALLFLREAYGLEEDGCTLSIYLSREDMASLSNMTTSNAIRTLSSFAQEHLIAIDGRKIKLIDPEALSRVSQFG